MKNIKSKILLAMLSLMLIVLLALVGVFQWYVNKSASETLNESMLTLSAQAASNFDYMIKDTISDIQSTAMSYEYSSLTTNKERIAHLTEKLAEHPEMNSFAVYTRSGQLLEYNDKICPALVHPDDVSACAAQMDTYITEVRERENANYFVILVPLISEDNIELITSAAIDCSVINDRLAALTRNDSTELFVVEKSGRVIFTSGHGHAAINSNPVQLASSDNRASELSQAVSTAINGRSGAYEYKLDGNKFTMGYSDVSYFDSVLIASADINAFNGDYSSKEYTILGLTFIILVLITLAYANYFSSRISRPIVAATERLRLLANGDTTSSVDIWISKDELGVLSNSLGETVSCLRLYISLIRQALNQIAQGNLTYRMESEFKGDFESIKDSFNEIFDSLCNTFDSINHSAQQVTSGAVQVANSAHSLSQGATQQASAIEELSATLTNVSDQVVQNSDSARNAYKIVDDNSHAIEDCNTDMGKLLDAMQLISRTADEITEILKAIDEISFQTNILALNAAVEAAREGSKGFGVVADEVRRLAARTAEAAKQTSTLIDKTSDAVTRGHSIAVKTADSLREVEEGSAQICLLMRNIAEASAEQSDAIMQINTGVEQISDVVSANTAAAIGSASASEELSGQSLILKNMIARFKLTEGSAEPAVSEDTDSDYNFSIDDEPAPAKRQEPAPIPKPMTRKFDRPSSFLSDSDLESPAPRRAPAGGGMADIFMKRDNKVFIGGDTAPDNDDDEDDKPSGGFGMPSQGGSNPMLAAMFSKRDSDDDDDDDEDDKPSGGFGMGTPKGGSNPMLAAMFSKRDSDDDDDDDEDDKPSAGGSKPGIGALFKVDDDDDKY